MNSGLTQRLVGAVVLVAIGVIFVPTFLRDRQVEPVSTKTLIPDRPPRETVTFENPQPPENIEPAPEPDEMFMPEASTPPADQATERADAPASESTSDEVREQEASQEPQSPAQAEPDSSAQATDGQAWVIQVASFRSADSARDLRDRLQTQGYRAYIRSASTSAGEVSRVFIGPKISRDEAEATKSEVDQALKVDALIMRFEP